MVRGLGFCFWSQINLILCAQGCPALMLVATTATTSTVTRAEQSMQHASQSCAADNSLCCNTPCLHVLFCLPGGQPWHLAHLP